MFSCLMSNICQSLAYFLSLETWLLSVVYFFTVINVEAVCHVDISVVYYNTVIVIVLSYSSMIVLSY